MARAAGKKQAPAKVEDDDDESWDDAVVETDAKDGGADMRLRDWRDVERFREMKELRSLVDDDYGLEEIFRVPVKPRGDVQGRSKLIPPKAPAPTAPAKPAAKPAPKVQGKPAKSPAKPAPKPAAKAKAKRK